MLSKTMSSFYRRLLVAYLIDSGINTVPAILKDTAMPRRTAQDTIAALHEIGVVCEFDGATKNGRYEIRDWGPIRRDWVERHVPRIREALNYA